MKHAILLILATASLAACRSRLPQPVPPETPPSVAKMPMYDVPHAALLKTLRQPSGDERSVGTLKVDFGGKSLSAKLDLRIRSLPEPLIWMDVADPLIGLKIGRARVYQDSVQGFIRLYRQYVNEPLSRLRSMGIDLQTEDARRLALGLPVLVPTTWSEAQWTPQDSLLIMAVREQRGAYEVLVEVAVAPSNPAVVKWQRISSKGQALVVRYTGDGGWIAEVPSQSAKAEFRVSQRTKGEVLSFPFELPSDYARITF